jgi:hypothetical protein
MLPAEHRLTPIRTDDTDDTDDTDQEELTVGAGLMLHKAKKGI